jgi:ABC-type phosphate transport system substrate-binding protein
MDAWHFPFRTLVLAAAFSAGAALGPKATLGPRILAAQESAAIAIVTNPRTAVSDISFLELRKIFLGEMQFWGDNSRIVLLVRAPVARERDIVLSKIYRMGEAEFQQYWIAKVFRAEVSSKPKIVYSSDMTSELVTALPGAIGFLPLDEVGPGMKVLRINGKLPGETGYPLQ